MTLRRCWNDVYFNLPDVIAHDTEKHFSTSVSRTNAYMLHIKIIFVPAESSNSMMVAERYHTPIRRFFNITKKECLELEIEEALQMAVKSINASV